MDAIETAIESVCMNACGHEKHIGTCRVIHGCVSLLDLPSSVPSEMAAALMGVARGYAGSPLIVDDSVAKQHGRLISGLIAEGLVL